MSVDPDATSLDIQYTAMFEPIEINIKSLIKHSALDEQPSLFTKCIKFHSVVPPSPPKQYSIILASFFSERSH
jgi:hypothetical protein